MAEKFAIYFGEPLATATAGHEPTRSARLNQVAAEWLQIVRDHIPPLTDDEWRALMAITTSADLSDDKTLRLLWAAVEDAEPEVAAHGANPVVLAGKLRALQRVHQYALREVLGRAWAAQEAGEDASAAWRTSPHAAPR